MEETLREAIEAVNNQHLLPNGVIHDPPHTEREIELQRELNIALGLKEHHSREALEWRGKYFETLHHLHNAHRGLERYARRQRRWREEVAGLRARLGVRERLRRV